MGGRVGGTGATDSRIPLKATWSSIRSQCVCSALECVYVCECVWQLDKYQGGCAPYPNWRQRLNTARCPALDAMALLIDLPRPRAPAIRLEARLICQQGQQDSHFAQM